MWQADGTVVPVAPPSDEEAARILARVLRAAKKDWANLDAAWPDDEYEQLQQRATQERLGFGTDVLRCPCGGRRSIRSLHSTAKLAEARLSELAVALPSRVLPPATARRSWSSRCEAPPPA